MIMGGSPSIKKPKLQPPTAIPRVDEATGEDVIKRAIKKSGYRKTFLTGALTPETGKKTVLG